MKSLKRIFGWTLLLLLTSGILSGCYRTGRAIGESLREMEAKIDSFQQGYEDGRYGYFEGPSPFDILEKDPGPDLRSGQMPESLEPERLELEEPVVPPIPKKP